MQEFELIKSIFSSFNLGEVDEILLLPFCTNSNNYKVIIGNNFYVIKLLKENININPYYIDLKVELENKLLAENIPIRVAKTFNGHRLQKFNDRYFYIYDYYEGRVIESDKVILDYCRKIGTILSQIHQIEFGYLPKKTDEYLHIRWRKYLNLAEHKGSPITDVLATNIKVLEQATEKCNNAVNSIPNIRAITHGDLCCSNVIWQNDNPIIVDLEKINYGNPYIELLEVALLWSGIEDNSVNYNLFNNLTKEYFKNISRPDFDWKIIYDMAFKRRLKKAELNIKKALMIDCNSKEEQKKGEREVAASIKEVVYYANIKEEILSRLN